VEACAPQTPSWWGGGSQPPPQEPHATSALGLRLIICPPLEKILRSPMSHRLVI